VIEEKPLTQSRWMYKTKTIMMGNAFNCVLPLALLMDPIECLSMSRQDLASKLLAAHGVHSPSVHLSMPTCAQLFSDLDVMESKRRTHPSQFSVWTSFFPYIDRS